MIDFQVSHDDYGALLFCEDCAKELASLVGIEAIEQRNLQIKNLTERIQEVQEQNVRLNSTIDSILAVRPGIRGGSDTASESDEQDSDEGE